MVLPGSPITDMTVKISQTHVSEEFQFYLIYSFPDVHLTNVAIQKTSENYDEKLGGKWDLRTLKLYMMSQ